MSDRQGRVPRSLSQELTARLERELDEGERLIWVSQPDARRLVRQQWPLAIAFSSVFLGFAVFTGWATIDSLLTIREATDAAERSTREVREAKGVLWTSLIATMVFSLPMAWSVLFEPSRIGRVARNTVYAITPARAIVLHIGRRKITERDYRADELVHLLRRERRDGSGDLLFEAARGGVPRSKSAGGAHGFFAISDVLDVEKLLRRQFGQSGMSPSSTGESPQEKEK